MSLITRCPACGTMFKVVADQLKVSQGWVRCGQCSEVFDASAHLQPRSTAWQAPDGRSHAQSPAAEPPGGPAPVEAPEPAPLPAPPAPPLSLSSSSLPAPVQQDDEQDFDPAQWKHAQQQRLQREAPGYYAGEALAETPPPRPDLMRTATAEDPSVGMGGPYGGLPSGYTDDSSFGNSVRTSPSVLDDEPADDDELLPAQENDVSFVREARRKAFWRRPLVRAALGLVALLLIAVLALQAALQQRDVLAMTYPQAAPLLRAVCDRLRCEVRPPRPIEQLLIDGSTFTRIGADAYRLSFTLKNNSPTVVQTPSLELTLTDSQDQALVRRILSPAQFGASGTLMAARGELAGLVNIKVGPGGDGAGAETPGAGPLRVAGYRVLAFYPD